LREIYGNGKKGLGKINFAERGLKPNKVVYPKKKYGPISNQSNIHKIEDRADIPPNVETTEPTP
jgi:hypothetical protein